MSRQKSGSKSYDCSCVAQGMELGWFMSENVVMTKVDQFQ